MITLFCSVKEGLEAQVYIHKYQKEKKNDEEEREKKRRRW